MKLINLDGSLIETKEEGIHDIESHLLLSPSSSNIYPQHRYSSARLVELTKCFMINDIFQNSIPGN